MGLYWKLILLVICIHKQSVLSTRPNNNEGFFKQVADIFEDGGSTAVKLFLDRELNDWKNVKINLAVFGTSGTGKSSFINTVLGLTADDEGSAPVGVKETTEEVKDYPHPQYPNLVLWDLPGVGTPNFNRENYFRKININLFDYFIFMTSDRFRDDDFWFAQELNAKDKLFYFVRNKVGQDIDNNKHDHPKSHTESKVLDDIRQNCEYNLNKLNLEKKTDVYLIDLHEPEKYDFEHLMDQLVNDTSEKKKEALTLSMTRLTKDMILRKKEILSERIHTLSLMSGVTGAIPVLLMDSFVDIGILIEETKFYKTQFGLSEEMLQAYAQRSEMIVDQLTKNLNLQSRLIGLTAKGILSYLSKIGFKKAGTLTTAKYVKYVLPLFGNALSGAASYAMTSWCLHDLLNFMVEDALKINDHKLH